MNPMLEYIHLCTVDTFFILDLSDDLVQQIIRPLEERPREPKYLKAKRGADLLQNQSDVIFTIFLEALEETCCFCKIKINYYFFLVFFVNTVAG